MLSDLNDTIRTTEIVKTIQNLFHNTSNPYQYSDFEETDDQNMCSTSDDMLIQRDVMLPDIEDNFTEKYPHVWAGEETYME